MATTIPRKSWGVSINNTKLMGMNFGLCGLDFESQLEHLLRVTLGKLMNLLELHISHI